MEITTEELKEKIGKNEKLIVDFHGLWCRPCQLMKPVFDKIAEEHRNNNSEIQMYTMDVDKNRDFIQSLGIRGIPVVKSFSNGKEISSVTGLLQENQIKQIITNLLND